MRKIYSSLAFFILLAVFAGCKKTNFLDRAVSVNLTEADIFGDTVLTKRYADNAYNHLIDEYARFNDHRGITGQFADEAVSSNNDVAIRTITLGTYHDHYERGGESLNDIGDVWARAYAGIRIANKVLEVIDTVPFKFDPTPTRIKGEMHFIRAFLYFELIKRFGGVPIVKQAYGIFDDVNFPRNTYEECLAFIKEDLEAAEALLPLDYDNSNYGRATKGACMALWSRATLYAASKLNNPSDDPTKWAEAAAAAKAVMDMKDENNAAMYSLQATYKDILNVATSSEYIMIKVRPPRAIDGMLLDFAMSPGSGGAQGTLNPTQNHVDLYEMKATGKPITDPTSGYDPAKPYVGRDPRFGFNILYNDATWQGRKIEMWNGGKDYRASNPIYTVTRYYCRKLWPEAYQRNVSGSALINYIFFRYAEILLNYAEAQNEALAAPDQSVYDAINEIRRRSDVNMPDLPLGLTKDEMRLHIRNERAVELAFEDHRWYDIQRWKAGPEIVAQPMYGMDVVKNPDNTFTYTKVLLPANMQKVFKDYMHRYPIPRSEIYKSNGVLLQNPEW